MAPRSRNFDGCWTCRLRKIKCDSTRPICLRCKKANLECKGYLIILAWADSVTLGRNGQMVSVPMVRDGSLMERDSGLLRRNVDLMKFPKLLQFDNFDRLNSVVLNVDDESKTLSKGSYFEGPFGVYCVEKSGTTSPEDSSGVEGPHKSGIKRNEGEPPTVVHSVSPANSRNTSLNQFQQSKYSKSRPNAPLARDSSPSVGVEFPTAADEPETSIFSETDNAYVHIDLLDSAKLTILAIKGPRFEFSEQSMFHILYPKFFPNIESDEWRPDSKVLLSYFAANDGGTTTIKPLLSEALSYLDSSLISFVRVLHPNNPWDLWVVPLLKTVIFELVCEDYPHSLNWRTHFISKTAVEVLRGLLIRNIKLAILCMALASSTFQKSLLRGRRHVNAVNAYLLDDEIRRSIQLRKLGINMLNYHLDEYDNNADFSDNDGYDTYLLLAFILQIHLDNAYGVFENYDLLFAIGDFIIKQKPKHAYSPVAKYLREVYNILNLFYETTQAINYFNFSISEKEKNLKYLDLNDNYDLTKDVSSDERDDIDSEDDATKESDGEDISVAALTNESHPLSFTVHFNKNENPLSNQLASKRSTKQSPKYSGPLVPVKEDNSIYVSLGLPKSFLVLIQEVTQLANHKNVFRTKGVTPRNFPRLCAEIEDKIMSWKVENHWKLYETKHDPATNVTSKRFISKFHEGLYHYVASFQNAMLVFYKRLISIVPVSTYQDCIEKCFSAMEKLLALNGEVDEGLGFSPSFWPLLVCGCDIDLPRRSDLQARCQKLWDFPCFKKYNYWRAKQILYEAWSRRMEGEYNGFMDLIREWEIVLCLG